jgi:hypothetical protein
VGKHNCSVSSSVALRPRRELSMDVCLRLTANLAIIDGSSVPTSAFRTRRPITGKNCHA